MLFGKNKGEQFKKDELLEKIASLNQKCLRLEKKFLAKAENGDADINNRLALSCRKSADTLKECADLVSQMLPPRNKHAAKTFESRSRELLHNADETLRECESFDYPITNGILEAIVNDIKIMILDITSI